MTGTRASEHPEKPQLRLILRWSLVLLYIVAGLLHLAYPGPFLMITPVWVPFPEAVIFITGLCELAGALGLLIPALRRAAGLGLAAYAIAVFPANVKHMMMDMAGQIPALGLCYHLPRLALQPLLVWAAVFSSSDGRKTPRP